MFNITAYKDGVIQKPTSCPVRVRIKDGVYVTIIGKEDAIQGESVFVAKGLTYNLDVQIVGFEQDEVHFDSTNEQYASIRNNFMLLLYIFGVIFVGKCTKKLAYSILFATFAHR